MLNTSPNTCRKCSLELLLISQSGELESVLIGLLSLPSEDSHLDYQPELWKAHAPVFFLRRNHAVGTLTKEKKSVSVAHWKRKRRALNTWWHHGSGSRLPSVTGLSYPQGSFSSRRFSLGRRRKLSRLGPNESR